MVRLCLLAGYNVAILAYGQTDSGKTHSMRTNYGEFSRYSTNHTWYFWQNFIKRRLVLQSYSVIYGTLPRTAVRSFDRQATQSIYRRHYRRWEEYKNYWDRGERGDECNGGVTMLDPRISLAKFHLVDLAGSERSKKTPATGEQCLLALGNVISQS